MITKRPAAARGHVREGWLESFHTFSFADYYDPQHMGFRALRVINEDVVQPGHGFPLHPHRDMEIITYIVSGTLEHGDSLGHREIIPAGAAQRITAGRGIMHSEANPSRDTPVHLLQIWIFPRAHGLEPGYATRPATGEMEGLTLLAASEEHDGALRIEQDAQVLVGRLAAAGSLDYRPVAGRGIWLQLIDGELDVNGEHLVAGDGAAVEDEPWLRLAAGDAGAHWLLFDLA